MVTHSFRRFSRSVVARWFTDCSVQVALLVMVWFGLLHSNAIVALGGEEAREAYRRAVAWRESTQGLVPNLQVNLRWLDENRAWVRFELVGRRHEFRMIDARRRTNDLAFDHAKLAEALKRAGVDALDASRLPLDIMEFADDKSSCVVRVRERNWRVDLKSYEIVTDAAAKAAEAPRELKPLEFIPERSEGGGVETHVQFENRTEEEVELFWLDSDGRSRSYGKLATGEKRRQHTFASHVWVVQDKRSQVIAAFRAADSVSTANIDGRTLPRPAKDDMQRRARRSRDRSMSPDGEWEAFLRENNVWLRELATGTERALSQDGTSGDPYESRWYWSPNSKHLVVFQTQPAEDHTIHFIESRPREQVQPKLHELKYLKPGDRIARPRPRLFQVPDGKSVAIATDLFDNPWSIDGVRWEEDSSRFTFLYNQRGHQVLRLLAVDAESGVVTPIVNEQSPTFIDYAHKNFAHFVAGRDELIWMSERDGWNHLYLIDSRRGAVTNQITRGEWVVRSIERIDEANRQIWFFAGGIRPEQNPYYLQLARVKFDGTGLTILTEGNGNHSITFSPDRKYFIDTWSRVDQPPVHELRSAVDGALVCEVGRADVAELAKNGWRPPQPFVAKGRDSQTEIYGIVVRPSTFDPTRKYPVIEHIYAGPHGSFVPKSFRAPGLNEEIAELGAIVVQIDGMGTSHRSKKFHDVCWKNLADGGFLDRVAWIRALAAQEPSIDLARVGIFGGSAGGQNALRALLGHGDFYKVAVADCGCHDNRMDKIWWNELWMGWPVGPHYEEQSNVTQAHRLSGQLLLVVGELDRNVDPASTMQVAAALVKADRDFDLLVVPGAGHGAAETPYGRRRRAEFLWRHLIAPSPSGQ